VQQSFLDRYHQGASLIHRLDPRLKLLGTLAFVLATTSTPPRAWPAFVLLAALALGTTSLAGIPWLEALKRSAIALPFAGMVALSLPFTRSGQVLWTWSLWRWHLAVTDNGLLLFAAVIVKSWLSVMVSGLLVATTRFPDLLAALRALRVPVALTGTISFMYRYLFVLVDEAMRLQTARDARSAGPGRTVAWRARVLGGMIGSLFIRSYERSERIYAAMLARGFDGEMRTLMALTWQGRDSWAALAWALALACVALVAQMIARGVV
jgi:cobalt/nickel transport system permease protein